MLARALDHLSRLIAFPTVSDTGNRALIDWAAGVLAEAGARVEIWPDATGAKANLWATLGPEGPGGVMLSGHVDVVPVTGQAWTVDPFALTVRDGRAYGRGSCDMKGFVACVLALAPRWRAGLAGGRAVHVALTHDEEVGCLGAQAMAPRLADRPRPMACIVGEPTGMGIVAAHKGCYEYTTHFQGVAGHGSDPSAGVSAIGALVELAAGLRALAGDLRARARPGCAFVPPGSTLNLGRVTGGSARNTIADTAALEWEFRPATPEDAAWFAASEAALRQRVAAATGVEIWRDTLGEVAGLDARPGSAAVALAQRLTGAQGWQTAAYGTEAGLWQAIGIPTVLCGPGAIAQAHRPDEFVTLAQLESCLAMLTRLEPACAP